MIRILPRFKHGLLLLAGLGVLVLMFTSRLVFGHEARTIERLVQSGLVTHKEGVRLLHSTGFRRENTHIYQVPVTAVILEQSNMLEPEDYELRWAREHLQKNLNPSSDWSLAEFYSFAAGKDDDWILWSAVVVKVPEAPPWVILSIF